MNNYIGVTTLRLPVRRPATAANTGQTETVRPVLAANDRTIGYYHAFLHHHNAIFNSVKGVVAGF
jgi:hypothetical protein